MVFTGEEDKSGQVHTQVWVPQGAVPCGYKPGNNQIQILAVRVTSSSGSEENTASTEEVDTTKDNKDTQAENKTTLSITSEGGNAVESREEKRRNNEETETSRSSVGSDIKATTSVPSLNKTDQTDPETRDSPVGTPSQRNDDEDDKETDPEEETCESIGVAEELKRTAFKGPEIILNRWRQYKIELVIEDLKTTKKSKKPLILTHDTYFWKCSGSCHKIPQKDFCNNHPDCPDESDESKDNCEVSKLPQKTAFGFYGALGRKGNQGLVAYFCDWDKTFVNLVNIGLLLLQR